MTQIDKFRKFIYNEHDVVCNQKYADKYPYSMHLSFVEAQGEKFIHLLDNTSCVNKEMAAMFSINGILIPENIYFEENFAKLIDEVEWKLG